MCVGEMGTDSFIDFLILLKILLLEIHERPILVVYQRRSTKFEPILGYVRLVKTLLQTVRNCRLSRVITVGP